VHRVKRGPVRSRRACHARRPYRVVGAVTTPNDTRTVPSLADTPLIQTPDELEAACARLQVENYITVDTEFIRDNTYWPRLCLVQIASAREAVAIDPLAQGMSLQPVYDLLADTGVVKVFHAARQDIEIFLHDGNVIPQPIFDTQIAAMVCGYGDSVGYDTLAQKVLGITLDKSARLSDWARRPLSDRQIRYALEDVIHLREIYEDISGQVARTGRSEWMAEEVAALTAPATYDTTPELAWRRLKTRTSNRRFLGLLRELAAWREREAQRRNIPRNRVVRDEALLEIAAHPPRSGDDLRHFRAFPKGLVDQADGRAVLDAVSRAQSLAKDELPSPPPRRHNAANVGSLVDLLKVLLKAKCEQHNVAQRLVASSEDLELLAGREFDQVRATSGWRAEIFGNDARRLIRGEIALAADERRIRLIETGSPEDK
jgi:ribonuclease D